MEIKQSALAVTLALAAINGAHAQSFLMQRMATLSPEFSSGNGSSVRLYGTVDVGAMYSKTDNAAGRWQEQSGGVQTSKFGLYGQEDLGGGLKAEFKLESGILADTGAQQASSLFNRESWVGLKSAQWGTVRMGNQINAMLPLYIDPFGLVATNSAYAWVAGGVMQTAKGVGYNTDLGVGAATIPVRVPKSFTYATPWSRGFGGFHGQVIYATNTSGATNPSVATRGGVAEYLHGPFYLAASLIQAWGSPVSIAGAQAHGIRTDIPSVGAIYDDGKLVLSTSYAKIKPRAAQNGEATLTTLGAILPRGAWTYRASAVYRDTDGARDSAGKGVASSALGLMLGADYDLSRRTALYARAGMVRNFGASTIILNSVALPLVAGSTAPQTGIDTRTFSLGMYHHF